MSPNRKLAALGQHYRHPLQPRVRQHELTKPRKRWKVSDIGRALHLRNVESVDFVTIAAELGRSYNAVEKLCWKFMRKQSVKSDIPRYDAFTPEEELLGRTQYSVMGKVRELRDRIDNYKAKRTPEEIAALQKELVILRETRLPWADVAAKIPNEPAKSLKKYMHLERSGSSHTRPKASTWLDDTDKRDVRTGATPVDDKVPHQTYAANRISTSA